MAEIPEIKLLEKCRVAPPPDSSVAEFTVPLSFFDMQWLISDAEHHLHFYRFRHPSPNPKFIISSIKSSLSLVLKHFLPLAGNLIWPVDSDRMPELRYKKGDSVSLTIAESSLDFDYLAGDHQRESCKFYDLLPQLPEPIVTSGDEVSPLFALQVTLFSNNTGICIGRNLHQVVGDAASFMNFNKLWVLIDKSNEDSLKLFAPSSQPLYDRSVVQDPFHLGRKIFNEQKLLKSQGTPSVLNPTISKDEVRATFILHPIDIMKLKKFISLRNHPNLISNNTSTFTVTCAFMWTCFSKSLNVEKEKVEEEDKCANLCAFINCRQRFAPPIPQNYFGNCFVPCLVGSTHGKLVGNEGLSVAATAIGDAIHKRLHDYEGVLRGDWISPTQTTAAAAAPAAGTLIHIVGSTQRNVHDYDADFGWGKLEKHESVSTNSSATLMLITRSRRFEGALELGTSLPKKRMDAFATIFTNSISSIRMRSPL